MCCPEGPASISHLHLSSSTYIHTTITTSCVWSANSWRFQAKLLLTKQLNSYISISQCVSSEGPASISHLHPSSSTYIHYNQGFGSVFIWFGSVSNILGWIPIRDPGFLRPKIKKIYIRKKEFSSQKEHPALLNMKFLNFSPLFWVIFGLLDSEYGSGFGSTGLIESGSNPDPKPWLQLPLRAYSLQIQGIFQQTCSKPHSLLHFC
jgi:hypothetical protein